MRTVESHIRALLRKLGVADRAARVEVGAEIGRAAHIGTALPVPLTSFVGRRRETDEIAALLRGHRLLTLTGPAGAGKTRLALHVAASVADRFSDDVRLADLLAAGGQLRVLATSREVLGVPGEVSYEVQPLPVPIPRASSRAATAAGYDAVRLFVDRAAGAVPGFALTDANASAVAALCQRLDGLPLAIELAASRVRSFPPTELVEHLDQRFELLSGGARAVLPRHRTLRAAIDWSYDLLGDEERALFDRLGVFPADFDYDAVEVVCATGESGGGTPPTTWRWPNWPPSGCAGRSSGRGWTA